MKKNKGQFKKGNKPQWTGKKVPEDVKKKISESVKKAWERGELKGYPKGRPNPKIREVRLKEVAEGKHNIFGEKNPMYGKKHSDETLKKMRSSNKPRKGKLNNFWKGGITPINAKIRESKEYKKWRNEVFKRDEYICKMCYNKKRYVEAHHIKKFSEYPELRFDVDNGITLCRKCHNETKHHEKKWEFFFEWTINLRRHLA